MIPIRSMLAPAAALLLSAGTHPTHDSFSELNYDAARRTLTVRIRAFADDLGTAIAAMPAAARRLPPDSAMARYVGATVLFIDASGRLVSLRWLGAEQQDDAIVMRLGASAPAGLRGWRLSQALLVEHYTDQVNVVHTIYGGRNASLLFTRGDVPKALP